MPELKRESVGRFSDVSVRWRLDSENEAGAARERFVTSLTIRASAKR
jgi:hypothetical protein